jgi:cyclophilin family peptidyl-prolyl cis-trans isomerase
MSILPLPRPLQALVHTAICVGALVVVAAPASAVEFDLVTTSITMPTDRTFQMPLTASDPSGGPLTFSMVSIKPKVLASAIAPSSNPSLVLNVSGVDSNNTPFTGTMVLQLYQDLMPLTTARIITLVNSNFYNGLTFYRVVQDFVCQGGNKTGTGATIDDEYVATLQFTGFGQLAMANAGHGTSDSEIFITDPDASVDNPTDQSPQYLDFSYNLFGQLTRGFDVEEKIMGTAVDTNDMPLTPVVINTATITNDTQAAVLRLAAGTTFTGTVAVTVKVMNASKESVETNLTVNVIPNTVTDPPFFGPIPDSITITQGQAASFILETTDIDGDQLSFSLEDTATGQYPTYLQQANFNPAGHLWLVPDLTVTGTVNLAIGVTDSQNSQLSDTKDFSVVIVPRSATPTMTIVPKSGTVIAATNASAGRITIAGSFTFADQHTFGSNDTVALTIGDQAVPFALTYPPADAGFSAKKGVITLKSSSTNGPTISAQFNSVKDTFNVSVSKFDFPGTQNNPLQIGLQIGQDYGTNVLQWTSTKPGVFTLPK